MHDAAPRADGRIAQLKGELALILDSLLHDEELPSSGRKDDV